MSLIVIVADSVREDVIGCRGARQGILPPGPHRLERPARTPTLNRLASEGVVFDRAISAAPWTVPSVAAMLTGVYAHRLGLSKWEQPFPQEFPTLFDHARAAGVTVASFVFNPTHLFRRVPEAGVVASSQDVSAVLSWLNDHRGEEFFLFCHYWWTHIPYLARAMDVGTWRKVTQDVLGVLRASPEAREGVKKLYRHAVEQFSEDFLPRLLDHTDLDRTHVVVTADHGESWGERAETAALTHVFDLHGNALYDEVLRVPLLVRSPRGPRGHRVPELVRTVDLGPSLAALLGWPLDDTTEIDGVDLSSTLRAEAAPPPLDALSVMNRNFVEIPRVPRSPEELFSGYAMTTKRYKLVLEPATGVRRAFDLETDPGELTDLVAAGKTSEALSAGWHRLGAEAARARVVDFDPGDLAALASRLQALGYVE